MTAAYTLAALVAFAGNSILCRMALAGGAIDPVTFTAIRLVSGAAALWLIGHWAGRETVAQSGAWSPAAMLFAYALPFSLAYVSLSAGTGALILFGAVQLTMIAAALRAGERPGRLQWIGFTLAVAGLITLLRPGLSAPPPVGAALMVLAGVSWGLYSLLGRGVPDPLAQTGVNFLWAAPMSLAAGLVALPWMHVAPRGAMLAAASGALTSGVGYVLWYSALRGLSASRAAFVQLPVPVLTAVGGVLLLGETVSLRLLIAAAAVISGIALTLRRTRG
jgi:drug/metabolite transporter (DMT)-like permease